MRIPGAQKRGTWGTHLQWLCSLLQARDAMSLDRDLGAHFLRRPPGYLTRSVDDDGDGRRCLSGWEELAMREDLFAECCAHGVDGLVDDLAEAELESHAAQNVCVDVTEAPATDEEIDHAAGGGARGAG